MALHRSSEGSKTSARHHKGSAKVNGDLGCIIAHHSSIYFTGGATLIDQPNKTGTKTTQTRHSDSQTDRRGNNCSPGVSSSLFTRILFGQLRDHQTFPSNHKRTAGDMKHVSCTDSLQKT